jgi:O-antigen/teichoic acid export membrane protein
MPLKIHFNQSMFNRLWSERLVFLSSLINNLNQTVSIIILASFVSYSQVGVFSLGWRMMNVIQVLVSVPILQALFPVLGVQLRSDIQEGTKLLNRSIPLLLIIVTIASGSLWLVSPWLINFFFGAEFIDAAGVYQLIAFVPLISLLNHLIGSSFLLNLGYDNDVLRVTIVASITAIILNLFLISSYGLRGAIIALILTEIILLTLYSAICKRRGLTFWSINQWKLSLVIDHLKAIIKGGALSKK